MAPTQEERINALEQITEEHHLTLQTLTYDMATVKGFVVAQSRALQKVSNDLNFVKKDMHDSFQQLVEYHIRTENQIDARFNQADVRFNQVEARLDKIEANMATKDDIVNMATKDDIVNMATKDDLANMATKDDIVNMATNLRGEMVAMENRILNAVQQLVTVVGTQRPQSE